MEYPFLAHPPPSLARATRRRSSTFSAIATWAAHVQPGSPASLSPCSPHRRLSLRKDRRPSIASIHIPSAPFLHIAPTPTTPTPSSRNFKADLTSVGYTSVFLHLPHSPLSATLGFPIKPSSQSTTKNIAISPSPSTTRKPRGFARFPLLTTLRSRGRSKSTCPNTPTKMDGKTTAVSTSATKSKYGPRPPPLVNELALMQFADGGNMDDNIKRVIEARGKAAGAVGLDDIYRDGNGGIWWDQDEEWEYAHLLAEGNDSRSHVTSGADLQWTTFGGKMSPSTRMPGDERRGSLSTQDSDLDPKYIVQPTDVLDGDDLALFGGVIVPLATRQPPSVLCLPARPRRGAKHLQKSDFLVDVAFSRLHGSPKSPMFPSSSSSLRSKGKGRRRPAPLKLLPPSPASKRPTNSPIDADRVRKDFIETTFEPVISVSVPATPTPAASVTVVSATTPTAVVRAQCNRTTVNVPCLSVNQGLRNLGISMKRKPSMLNMMGLFRSAVVRKEDDLAC